VFADDYPRFNELIERTPDWQDDPANRRSAEAQRNRMNERYEALFAANRDIFEGARVLDLASHDGRWSFAALKTGAAHVTGVEVRQNLIDRAEEAFAFYDQDPQAYRFIRGDIFGVLSREELDVDVVLCFGFLYHTYRHTELMHRLHRLAPHHLIVDTMVTRGTDRTLRMIREEDVEDVRSAAPDPWAVGRVLVLRPSVPALELLLRSYGFQIESRYDWQGRLADRSRVPGLEGYANGTRVTVRCRSRSAAAASGAGPVRALRMAAPGPRPDPSDRERARTAPGRPPVGGWRERVNKTLARTTGYQLRRASTDR
jgi:2-polyprenyl-3-methyl-5-hydroxy-6-metoxy-1,4-benzoquinol methylase